MATAEPNSNRDVLVINQNPTESVKSVLDFWLDPILADSYVSLPSDFTGLSSSDVQAQQVKCPLDETINDSHFWLEFADIPSGFGHANEAQQFEFPWDAMDRFELWDSDSNSMIDDGTNYFWYDLLARAGGSEELLFPEIN